MVSASINSLTVNFIQDSGAIVKRMAMVLCTGKMARRTSACGRMIKWMEMEYFSILTKVSMKVNGSKTKRMATIITRIQTKNNLNRNGTFESRNVNTQI